MLCKVKFTTVDPKEDFGKYAVFVTESDGGFQWREHQFEDEAMLFSVLKNFGATDVQKADVLEHLRKESAVVLTEFDMNDNYAFGLRE